MAFFEEFQHLKIQLEEIKSATDNFADNKAIGVGGFGKVYKGEICHSKGKSMAAFKRLDSRLGQGNSEFWKEIVMLSRYSHENLVSLLGYCDEGGEKILVYEYASRGSLDRHLSTTTLTWIQRLNICLGVARALRYLHDPDGTQQRVIHRDIKSANILLDENWNAKVSDLGLSKIGHANQQHTAFISNVVGTLPYLDPMYLKMGLLTKESDVYSLGVVLFEALCGRLCFEYNNVQYQILVHTWKQCYEQKKLEEIIFRDLIQKMSPGSLETFSDVAYLCLQESREERPLISQVVEKLDIALRFQEMYEHLVVPKEDEAIFYAAVTHLVFKSEEELKGLLSKGILVNRGKTWFSLNKDGKHCELISATECTKESPDEYISEKYSRFAEVYCLGKENTTFRAHFRARFLSPGITYTVNLVFKFLKPGIHESKHALLEFSHQLEGERESSTPCLSYWGENGWMMSELYQFTSDGTSFDLDIRFDFREHIFEYRNRTVVIEGIEFRPLSHVEYEVLEDEEVDTHPTLSIEWEQKLPDDYKQIIKHSKRSLEWTTKKELYHLFCQGFLINIRKGFLFNKGEEWFFLAKNGKKCLMLPAREILVKSKWSWKPLSTSRFKEVAFDCHGRDFVINIKIKSGILSPHTTYACYLVYEITENHSHFMFPVSVYEFKLFSNQIRYYFYLLGPHTRVICPKDDGNTHNPSDIANFKVLPQLRKDGWMEVQVSTLQSSTIYESEMILLKLVVGNHFHMLNGLIVQGIEFKPTTRNTVYSDRLY
ncbi:hypothetical protein OSB04_030309 [Centaurea solstitialis]|uniref:non-specific serine/threonine protein kinase n=1 Tax=Centaurea solstitialis TaxID=347529 RepID=A0AA38W711_9ASTR|nr:hypothetical protein OSB04_030309 [Centaurea solstitialis]